MKYHFLYKVTNRATGRMFIARHASKDAYFATPAQQLNTFKTQELQPTALPQTLYMDIQHYGIQHFFVESIQASADSNIIKQARIQLLTQLRASNTPLYNTNRKSVIHWTKTEAFVPHRMNTTNPMRCKWIRDKVRDAMLARVIIKDNKFKVVKHLKPEEIAKINSQHNIDLTQLQGKPRAEIIKVLCQVGEHFWWEPFPETRTPIQGGFEIGLACRYCEAQRWSTLEKDFEVTRRSKKYRLPVEETVVA